MIASAKTTRSEETLRIFAQPPAECQDPQSTSSKSSTKPNSSEGARLREPSRC